MSPVPITESDRDGHTAPPPSPSPPTPPLYLSKSLRHIADTSIIKSVYLALCQFLLYYCISSWGGAAKTHLLTRSREQPHF